jgi:murein DD-endopeptidase MepM/ murein hydrolase activator NlpD
MKKSVFLCSFVIFTVLLELMMPGRAAAAEYIVQPGDTLTHIARRFGTTIDAIVQANDIADPNLIIVGQVLEIPTGTDSDSSTATVFVPTESLLVADFDNCAGTNNLGGIMGAAFQEPGNRLTESYVLDTEQGCAARLEYEIKDWGAFWMKLQDARLTPFRESNGFLTFDIRADEPIPNGVKIELKRFCAPNAGCGELSVYYMTGITSDWQTRSVPLDGFGTTGWAATLSSWGALEELVFAFEAYNSGNNGTVYLDNITFVR